jgi:hypothetical protein
VLATWRRGIAAVVTCPNVLMKLGGPGMPRPGFDWHTRQQPIGSVELVAAMAPDISTPWPQPVRVACSPGVRSTRAGSCVPYP